MKWLGGQICFTIIPDSLSPDSMVFLPPGNRTNGKIVLFMTTRFSKFHGFFAHFTRIFKIFSFLKLKKWFWLVDWVIDHKIVSSFWLGGLYVAIYHK